jgi:hypothetical protein
MREKRLFLCREEQSRFLCGKRGYFCVGRNRVGFYVGKEGGTG